MTSQCSAQIDAFRDLSRIFGSRDGRVLEFEILPPAFGSLLEDGCSIGVTKKYLVQAFVAARRAFFDGLKSSRYNGSHSSPEICGQKHPDKELDQTLAIASEIMLLFDCEHLTACNWRKRRLTALGDLVQEEFFHALDTELSLTTSYLCSPLHRHTKSPTLWQHRQWVREHLVRLRKPSAQAAQELLKAELSAVLLAGERHPKNYYAFTYMRQIHRIVSEASEGEIEGNSTRLAQSIITPTLDWCLAHPTDISGLMFLLYLLDAVGDAALRLETVGRVTRFALDIGWEGESIWSFVDLAVRKFNLAGFVGDPQTYPWDIFLNPVLSDKFQHGDSKCRAPWKAWLDRAQIHWTLTQPSTNNPPA
ncbi:uncharacterized protein BJX67DRAFT_269781 [Aspergillus lucknowensis]|uniref:Uncharacterized protein n=1 Tax=Aspergillus lucknowensis TaxID=176173 RepID=A0ABR4LEX1_9EURO